MRAAAQRVIPIVFLGIVPVLVTVFALSINHSRNIVSADFHNELYRQAEDVLHGRNPYPAPDSDLSDAANPVWPVATALAVAPLVLLPARAADWFVVALELGCLFLTLLLLGVRDWRVFGVTLLWTPVISATQTGNVTLALAVLCALAWRYRSARFAPGAAVGVGIAIKFFVWPLVLWLAATRRFAAAVLAATVGASSLLLILPFDSLRNYVALVRNLSRTFDGESYTVYALLSELGAPSQAARLVWVTVGLAILAAAWRRQSLTLSIGACLFLSPIVWLHYFALLVVPLAIAAPTFQLAWLIPLPMWFAPGMFNGRPWQNALVLICASAVLVVCAGRERKTVERPLGTAASGTAT